MCTTQSRLASNAQSHSSSSVVLTRVRSLRLGLGALGLTDLRCGADLFPRIAPEAAIALARLLRTRFTHASR